MKQLSIRTAALIGAIALVAVPSGPGAAEDIREERVRFDRGASSTSIEATIAGDESVDYLVAAQAGQTMHVSMKTDNGANYFNVLPPGSQAAIANGAVVGNEWTGTLPADGDYRVRVYLMRSASRRGEKARYTLSVGVTGSDDAKVAGTPFHATGTVPCSVGPDPRGSNQCSFGVIRGGSGNADVHLQSPGFDVTLHKDGVRILRFAGQSVTSRDAAEKVTAQKREDIWSIAVDDFYFYEIPEAVIAGG